MHIGDAAIEAFLSGNGAAVEHASLAALADELRDLACGPAPAPTPELAALLVGGLPPGAGDVPAAVGGEAPGAAASERAPKRRRRLVAARYLAGLSVMAKVGLGVGVAAASAGVAGAAGALPEPVQAVVAGAVEAVTPFSLPSGADDEADFGERVSTDARDGGVDGRVVSEEAKRRADERRADEASEPGRPGDAGERGLDRAGGTPAGDNGASPAPAGPPDGAGPDAAPPASAGPPDGAGPHAAGEADGGAAPDAPAPAARGGDPEAATAGAPAAKPQADPVVRGGPSPRS